MNLPLKIRQKAGTLRKCFQPQHVFTETQQSQGIWRWAVTLVTKAWFPRLPAQFLRPPGPASGLSPWAAHTELHRGTWPHRPLPCGRGASGRLRLPVPLLQRGRLLELLCDRHPLCSSGLRPPRASDGFPTRDHGMWCRDFLCRHQHPATWLCQRHAAPEGTSSPW